MEDLCGTNWANLD